MCQPRGLSFFSHGNRSIRGNLPAKLCTWVQRQGEGKRKASEAILRSSYLHSISDQQNKTESLKSLFVPQLQTDLTTEVVAASLQLQWKLINSSHSPPPPSQNTRPHTASWKDAESYTDLTHLPPNIWCGKDARTAHLIPSVQVNATADGMGQRALCKATRHTKIHQQRASFWTASTHIITKLFSAVSGSGSCPMQITQEVCQGWPRCHTHIKHAHSHWSYWPLYKSENDCRTVQTSFSISLCRRKKKKKKAELFLVWIQDNMIHLHLGSPEGKRVHFEAWWVLIWLDTLGSFLGQSYLFS